MEGQNNDSSTDETVDKVKDSGVEPVKVSGFINKQNYCLVSPKTFDGDSLMMDGEPVESLNIRKLRPTELMGIDMSSVGVADVETTIELLQRSCDPALSFEMVSDLDLPVLLEAAGVFKGFFMGTASET